MAPQPHSTHSMSWQRHSDTLNELAQALSDDASFSTTITNLINANETHIDNVATLSGVAKDETGLSTFTGSTISDGATIKEALQDLETAVEVPRLVLLLQTSPRLRVVVLTLLTHMTLLLMTNLC